MATVVSATAAQSPGGRVGKKSKVDTRVERKKLIVVGNRGGLGGEEDPHTVKKPGGRGRRHVAFGKRGISQQDFPSRMQRRGRLSLRVMGGENKTACNTQGNHLIMGGTRGRLLKKRFWVDKALSK